MKQISIQITDETARQIAQLAQRWGLPPERHNTPVIERAVATLFVLEIGYEEYTKRLKKMMEGGNTNETQKEGK
jgi:predicted transcriptional regulator